MKDIPPKAEGTPGVIWRKARSGKWEARWRPRTDLVKRGYDPMTHRMWQGTKEDFTEVDRQWLSDRSTALQAEMLTWGRGGVTPTRFDGTIRSLIRCYQTDEYSDYLKLRANSRKNYDVVMRRLDAECGDVRLSDLKAREIKKLHERWHATGKVAMAHRLVGMLRTLTAFGSTMLEDADCERIRAALHLMKFELAKPRVQRLTAEQVVAIRAEAHRRGLHSMALAQAIQFDLMLRQKDVIGEWVPLNEAGVTEIQDGQRKWLRGIRWSEIDNMILRHVTSKRLKEIEVDLRLAPMVMEELERFSTLPSAGPFIVREDTGRPYTDSEFRVRWRRLADAAGIPKDVRNMDSRAGAISEATDAGAALESIRHAATHSDISMTQRYSRGSTEKTAKVMELRAAHRGKNAPGKA